MRDYLIGRPYRLTFAHGESQAGPLVATFMGYLVGKTDEWLGTVWRRSDGGEELRLADADGPLEAEEVHQ